MDEFRSAEDLVFQHLRNDILAGKIKAGTPINQAEVAATLNVSRIPVRDALQRLQSVGLLVILPNRRAIVPSFTMSDIGEMYEMRALLEGLIARHAVKNFTKGDIEELATLAEMMRRHSDLDAYTKRHEMFHELIGKRSGLPRVHREVTKLREILMPYIRVHSHAFRSAELKNDTHDALVKVFRAKDAKAAEKALVHHVRSAGQQLIAALERLSDGEAREEKAGKRSSRPVRGGLQSARSTMA